MNEFLMALPEKGQYYFDKIDVSKVNIAYTKKENCKIIFKVIRRINIKLIKHGLIPLFNKKVCYKVYDKKIVDAIVYDTGLAILDSFVGCDLLYLIKKTKPKKMNLLIWNPIDDNKANFFKRFVPLNQINSYSEDESKRYNFKHFNDFYLIDYPYQEKKVVRDFYFLGRNKARMGLIETFANLIKGKYSYQFDIYVKEEKKIDMSNPLFNYFSEYIPFPEYLNRVFESRCLIDFNTTTNITFRTLESLIFKKKYISNNQRLKEMDFYNPNNIFIADENTTLEDIEEFLNLPYIEIDRSILERYDFYNAYNIFKKKSEEQ